MKSLTKYGAGRSKFGVRTDAAGKEARTVDGILFASKREAKRYSELKLLLSAKLIDKLKLQPRFPITVEGEKICTYVADFEYVKHIGGKELTFVEDSKGFKTPEYKLKKKLMLACHGIVIQEV